MRSAMACEVSATEQFLTGPASKFLSGFKDLIISQRSKYTTMHAMFYQLITFFCCFKAC